MTDDELIRMNMLIHGHNENVELLKLDEKLVDLAVMLASTDDYEQTDFKPIFLNPKIILKDSRVFLREKFVLHKIPYADEVILKMKLHGQIIRKEKDLIRLYNSVGNNIDPFDLPVKFVNEPYYYGNVSLLTNLSEDESFLKNMKLFFKSIELGNRTNEMSSVCYVHEIVHTQIESLKGIVKEYYNSEILSIFLELVYASSKSEELFKETLKNRINMFLIEFQSLFNYLVNNVCLEETPKWHNVIACKYIVSTLKAFNLYDMYSKENEFGKSNIIWSVQKVFSGIITLENMLNELGITYQNSLDAEHVANLIYK